MRCLLVDDHRLVAQVLGGLLCEVCNFEQLDYCHSVAEAVWQIQRSPPDLLLLDLSFPGEHWRDASDVLLSSNPDGRIIFLTGVAEGFSPPLELQPITLAVVEKTHCFAALVEVVQRWCRSRSNGSETQQPYPWKGLSDRLSPRELRVFEALGRGMLNKEIARALGLTTYTVETYRKSICAQLGISGAELVRAAVLHRCCNPSTALSDRPAA